MESDFRPVSVAILQPVADLLAQSAMAFYQKDLLGPDGADSASLYLTDFADGKDLGPTTIGGPIVMRYASEGCAVELPAGRQFMVATSGPVVGRAEMVLPMEPMTWDGMQLAVMDLILRFDRAGWTRNPKGQLVVEGPEYSDFTEDAGPKSARIGEWFECGAGPGKAFVEVMHYNSLAGNSFTPPAVLGRPLPDDAPDRFLINVYFSPATSGLSDKIGDLVMARRAAEGIDPGYEKLPASIWLDDPDWRPEGWTGGF